MQNALGGRVNILEGHSIGHSKQNVHMYMCLIPNSFRDTAIVCVRVCRDICYTAIPTLQILRSEVKLSL
jgi:hypothetical protein